MFYIDPNLPAKDKAALEAELALAKENAELYYNTHGMPLCYSALPQVNGEAEVAVQPELAHSKSELEFDSSNAIEAIG